MCACSAASSHPYLAIDLSVKEKPCLLMGENRVPIDREIVITRDGPHRTQSLTLNCDTAREGYYARVMLMMGKKIENIQKCAQLILDNSKAVLYLDIRHIKPRFTKEGENVRPNVEFGLYYDDFDEDKFWPPLFFPKDQFNYEVACEIKPVDCTVEYEVRHCSHGFIRTIRMQLISKTAGPEAEQVSRMIQIFNRMREKTCSSISIDDHLRHAKADALINQKAPAKSWQYPRVNRLHLLSWSVGPTFVSRLEETTDRCSYWKTSIDGIKEIEDWMKGSS